MKLLLDTHAFLWWIVDSPQLSERARESIGDGENELFFSAASALEIAIKVQLGKLALPADPVHFVLEQLAENSIQSLPVLTSHALHVATLPAHHRDPFDRLLVAQSQLEQLPILTGDTQIAQYAVEIVW